MNKLLFVVYTLFFSTLAVAKISERDKQELVGINLIRNAGGENGIARWSASGSAVLAHETTNVGFGNGALNVDFSADAETLTSTAVAIPAGMYDNVGVARVYTKLETAGDALKLQVYDGTNVIAEDSLTTSADQFVATSVYFSFPSSGNISMRIIADGAATTDVYVDGAWLGLAEGAGMSEVSQAEVVGTLTYAGTTDCDWTASNADYDNFAADTDCPTPTTTGDVSAPSTKIPGVKLDNIGPGKYVVVAQGRAFAAAGNECNYRLSDGTNASGHSIQKNADAHNGPLALEGVFEYDTAQSSVTIQVQTTERTAAGACNIFNVQSDNDSVQFNVYRYPTASQTALNFDSVNWKVDATVSPATSDITLSGSDQTSPIDPDQSNLSLTINTDLGSASDVEIACISGTAPEGTTCNTSAVNESLGIAFTPPRAGKYEVCAALNVAVDDSFIQMFLAETGLSDDTIAQPTALQRSYAYARDETSVQTAQATEICQTFSFDDNSKRVVRVFYTLDVFTGGSNAVIKATVSDSHFDDGGVRFTVRPLDVQYPAPVVNNSITSNGTGPYRHEVAEISCNASSSVTKQTGTWISAIGNRSTASCAITIADGIFSDEPTACGMTIEDSTVQATSVVKASATSITVYGASADYNGNVWCLGPK